MVVRELIVDLDDRLRRFSWAAVGGRLSHHNASMQIFTDGGGCRAVWIADLLPHDLAGTISATIDQGLSAMKESLESRNT